MVIYFCKEMEKYNYDNQLLSLLCFYFFLGHIEQFFGRIAMYVTKIRSNLA